MALCHDNKLCVAEQLPNIRRISLKNGVVQQNLKAGGPTGWTPEWKTLLSPIAY